MSGGSRLSGHTLRSEGAPYDEGGRRIDLGRWYGVSGEGRALCSCGKTSPILPSAYRRKQWHREHKAAMRIPSGLPSGASDGE